MYRHIRTHAHIHTQRALTKLRTMMRTRLMTAAVPEATRDAWSCCSGERRTHAVYTAMRYTTVARRMMMTHAHAVITTPVVAPYLSRRCQCG